MHGFISIISLQNRISSDIQIKWKKKFDFQSEHIKRNIFGTNYQIEQFTANQFFSEKMWIDTDDFLFVTEGLIYNLSNLCNAYKSKNYTELIATLSNKNKRFFKMFEGNFAGVFFSKITKEWFFFNNQTGTKKLFYYIDKEVLIASTDLYTLSQALTSLRKPKTLNIDAAYLILTSGFMHEDLTLISQVKQLRAGEYVTLLDEYLKVNSYFHLSKVEQTNDSKKTIIETLDYKFKEAVKLEFNLDKSCNYNHLTTLSGGLDSRMTALIAYESGFSNQTFLNFSEKGYADEKIAKKIAKCYQMELKQIGLNAQGMNAIDDVVLVNDGLTIYTGSSHVFSTLNQINCPKSGIIHTGILGDAVMGSYVSSKVKANPNICDGMYSNRLRKRLENFLQKNISAYPSDELYKFYNRAFLGVTNGCLYFDLIGESSSPFLNSDFMSYAYSIPRNYKYKENIYIDWIKTLHPNIANFTWENIGGKPTNNNILRTYYRYKRAILKRLPINTMWKNNMNPEQLWYDNNESVKNTLDSYFSENIELLSDYKELRDDVIELYRFGNITEKTQALTLLSAYKLLFNE